MSMLFDEFKISLINTLESLFSSRNIDATIITKQQSKVNMSYESIVITPKDSNVGVSLNLDDFYHKYQKGEVFERVVYDVYDTATKALRNRPDISNMDIMDYSKAKDKLAVELISSEANLDMFDKIPSQKLKDMNIIYRVILSPESSLVVTNELLNTWGVTVDQLHNDAIEASLKTRPIQIRRMEEIMIEAYKDVPKNPGMEAMLAEMEQMIASGEIIPGKSSFVVNVSGNATFGAGVLVYPDTLDKIADRIGMDFFIFPSSLHEIIVMPEDETVRENGDDFLDMVKEINEEEVLPKDKLTDNVYHYDIKEKLFETLDEFKARILEKDSSLDIEDDPKEETDPDGDELE